MEQSHRTKDDRLAACKVVAKISKLQKEYLKLKNIR